MLQMVNFGIILDYFQPKAAQILQMISFGTILDHLGSHSEGLLVAPEGEGAVGSKPSA